jgi:protein O-mannosyl-transferase
MTGSDIMMTEEAPAILTESDVERKSTIAWPIATIIGIGILVYLNSFKGQFIFDDQTFLSEPSIRQLWPPWQVMFKPENMARPIVALSLAVNYAVSGMDVWSYHAFNLTVHILASLALFGIVRRSLLTEKMRERFGKASTAIGVSAALIWMVHPIQTQAVTYIVQRAESLMGLFYLLTLYCAIRAATSQDSKRWQAASFVFCLLGMGCKPVMATAPVMVFLYDYVFLSGSFKESLRRRWTLYASLASTWAFLAVTVLANRTPQASAGFGLQWLSPWAYLKTEFGVIAHYLLISVWPERLCFDYYWQVAGSPSDYLPYAILIGALVIASVYGLFKRSPLGFLGVWFFLILAPTSSVMPIADLAVEHRLYLSLASVAALAVGGGYWVLTRFAKHQSELSDEEKPAPAWIAFALVAVIVAWFGSLTVRRNADYHNDILMWADVLKKSPENPRAHTNLGLSLAKLGKSDEALAHFQEAVRIHPTFVEAYNNIGMILANTGKPEESLPYFYEAIRIRPASKRVHYNIGQVLAQAGKWDEAIPEYEQELQIDPTYLDGYIKLGIALEERKRFSEAAARYKMALSIWPEQIDAQLRLALLLSSDKAQESRNADEAFALADRAVQLTARRHPVALEALAQALAAQGHFPEAVATSREAMDRASDFEDEELRAEIQRQLEKYEGRAAR